MHSFKGINQVSNVNFKCFTLPFHFKCKCLTVYCHAIFFITSLFFGLSYVLANATFSHS